ncbi:MAG: hypothetical protein GY777_09845 [Candidatus Brocadiaceae bacterium]|nr:hypothetical protein [Candidatus Brocadiaceae bacterium]
MAAILLYCQIQTWINEWCITVLFSVASEKMGIFIHIPKMAGTSTYLQTGTVAPKMFSRHVTALFVRNRLSAEEWESLFKFVFVRNLWQRVVSMYRFYRSNGSTKLSDFVVWLIGLNHVHFIQRKPTSGCQQEGFLQDI